MPTIKDAAAAANPGSGFSGLTWRAIDFTFDASYATGGAGLTPADVGMSRIIVVIPATAGGYIFDYDYANQKVRAWGNAAVQAHNHVENTAASYTQNATTAGPGGTGSGPPPGLEVANATNLASVTVRLMVIGVA